MGSRHSEKIIIVMPAFNAVRTLSFTYNNIDEQLRQSVVLVDDGSDDGTAEMARALGIKHVLSHSHNRGYGANQKTCYREALRLGASIIVMLHPDEQYDARLISTFAEFVAAGTCDIMLGNRIRNRREALAGGMPKYKYFANRLLTLVANIILGTNLGDFHTGFRVFSRQVLENVNWEDNADDFSFDPALLTKAVYQGYRIGDAPIPCRYPADASSISFAGSIIYGVEMLWILLRYLGARIGIGRDYFL